MAINLLAKRRKQPVNLLSRNKTQEETETEPNVQSSFNDLSPENQDKTQDIVQQQIAQQHPNIPNWLRDAMLNLAPKDKSPLLDSAARGFSNVTNYIPQIAGGALQGASIPIRGVASTIPTDFTQKLANSKDLTNIFAQPETNGQKSVQEASEFFGALGPLGKMFGTLKSGAQLAKIPKLAQNSLALGGTGYLGTPGDVKDKAQGAATALALGGAGKVAGKAVGKITQKVPPFMRGLTSKSTEDLLVNSVQKPHDVLSRTADELYGQVRNAIKKRDIKIPVNEDHLKLAADILPKTRASRKLIDKARTGDYEAVHDLQSHLYKKGTKGLSSDDIALENQGEEIIELRNKINEDLEKHLIKGGNVDVAHVLRQGKDVYKKMMDTYFHKNLPKGIGKLVHPELRIVPENPSNLFKQKSVPMDKFLKYHPESAKHLKGIKEKEDAKKSLNKILIGSGVGGGVLSGGKLLYDLFK